MVDFVQNLTDSDLCKSNQIVLFFVGFVTNLYVSCYVEKYHTIINQSDID